MTLYSYIVLYFLTYYQCGTVTNTLENVKGKEKFVEPTDHVLEGGVRRSTRARKQNAKWRDFIVEG